MTERPLLRSCAQVRALLAGASRVRVPVRPQPVGGDVIVPNSWGGPGDAPFLVGRGRDSENAWREMRCPFGVVGDLLVVKEAWQCGMPAIPGTEYGLLLTRPEHATKIVYRASWDGADQPPWRSPATMPRRFSRLILEVAEPPHAQRLGEVTIDEARAEGIPQTAGEACALGLIDLNKTPGHEWDNRTTAENHARAWDADWKRKGFAWSPGLWTWVATAKLVKEPA